MRHLWLLPALLWAPIAQAQSMGSPGLNIPNVPAFGPYWGLLVPGGAPALLTAINGPSVALGVGDTGNAEGWSAVCNGTIASCVGQTFTATRQGYDTGGNATTYTDTLTVTKGLRTVYSGVSWSVATLNSNGYVALSRYLYPTDTVAGAANNTTTKAPKPICNWDEPARTVVGNTLHVAAVCFSVDARSGSEVAAVVFTASDGTTPASCTAGAMTKSTYTASFNAPEPYVVLEYACDINISALSNPHIVTLNALAYPWIGDSNSVNDSSTSSDLRGFSPRYYLRSTSLASSPIYGYVCPAAGGTGNCTGHAGNDATGVLSTTESTAYTTPFLTVQAAINKQGASALDGVHIRPIHTRLRQIIHI